MESISFDITSEILLAGDVSFLASLVLLAILSWAASQNIPFSNSIPMQWGFNGKPIWRAARRFGLLFTPVIAAITGVILSFLAHRPPLGLAHSLSLELLNLAIIRVGVAVAFVFAHILHLSLVLREIKK